jgi:hypothetical protein
MSLRSRYRTDDEAARTWTGAYRPYDLVREAAFALAGVTVLAVLLAFLFSSPDERPTTVRSWAQTAPIDFVTTAVSELDGSSGTAGYGPPYNSASSGQHIAFVHLAKWFGITHPINPAQDYVIGPLRTIAGQPALQATVTAYQQAPVARQTAWTAAYTTALGKANAVGDGAISLPPGNYGPVAPMMDALLRTARAGALDGALLTSKHFYQTDYTKILMFLADGGALASRAQAEHLLGGQWGMMNETGSYPGQGWLWLYTLWYQVPPFTTSWASNADIAVMAMMGALSLAFVLIPFLPGVRDLPRRIPIYRLVWREHYRTTVT